MDTSVIMCGLSVHTTAEAKLPATFLKKKKNKKKTATTNTCYSGWFELVFESLQILLLLKKTNI